MSMEEIKASVRQGYAKVAKGSGCCCGSSNQAESISQKIGYSQQELQSVPQGANLGLGCGNPLAFADITPGETVLDLGSGAGIDCFLAAQKVGSTGHVIGVDMTQEMIDKARKNAAKSDCSNTEFRLGEIEHLPVDNDSVDVVISNCVINLVPDKIAAFKEAYRVLKPNGRLKVSDIVLTKPLPESALNSIEAYVGCIAGAVMKSDYMNAINAAGFEKIEILDESEFPLDVMCCGSDLTPILETPKVPANELAAISSSLISLKVSARKPEKQ
ncbi:MAG: arsenite S-adenosylmethyltransferase [Planctomycetes bacterium GWF2_50_10]|nr:MAG: arsenite S-adenosylmethyltransferase [Planctomycetes bacterium GWF2_50_10]